MAAKSSPDESHPQITRLAFGSCHSRGAVNARLSKHSGNSTIWDVITTIKPEAFLWTGDAIYPPMKIKGDTPLDVMHEEYSQMLNNETLGYATFIKDGRLIGGVWDDHDYGGNDRGRELRQREERRDEYLDFLGVSTSDRRRQRAGLYSSVEFGSDVTTDDKEVTSTDNNRVKVIFLDTRWHREKHCIPSVGSNPYIPFGAIVACITRWITAGLNLPSHLPLAICPSKKENAVLGKEQWTWLQEQLEDSSASVHIIVSSIQVLTTNPVVESWGHFPEERDKLLRLLNNVPGLVILSGDVHHAEISTTSAEQTGNHGAIIEVTSSGLSHSCSGPKIYGPLCEPILNLFPLHRFEGGYVKDASSPSYYTGLNFGSIDFDWSSRSFEVKVHDEYGGIVLSTGALGMDAAANMSTDDLERIAACIDGHFLSVAKEMMFPGSLAGLIVLLCLPFYFIFKPSKSRSKLSNSHAKKD